MHGWQTNGLLPTSSPIGMQEMCIHDLQEPHWTHGLFSTSLRKYSCKQMLQMSSCCRHCLPLALGVWLLFVTFPDFFVLSLLAFLFAFCFFFFSSLSNCFRTFSSTILFRFSSFFASLCLIFFCLSANCRAFCAFNEVVAALPQGHWQGLGGFSLNSSSSEDLLLQGWDTSVSLLRPPPRNLTDWKLSPLFETPCNL